MKTVRKEEVRLEFPLTMPNKEQMELGTIYVSIKYQGANHLCLCGCGEESYLPLNAENGWSLFTDKNGKPTLSPSISTT